MSDYKTKTTRKLHKKKLRSIGFWEINGFWSEKSGCKIVSQDEEDSVKYMVWTDHHKMCASL